MRSLRALALFLITTLILVTAAGAQKTKTLHLASTAWSPFTNAPGKARYALDLVHTALKRLGITADTAIIDESRLSSSLIAGEFDGSAALWKDPAREKALFYSQPYLENRLILVGRKGSDVSAKSLKDLAGKRLALVEGYAYGDEVKNPNGPTYIGSASEEDSLRKLLDGTADYTLMDELVVEYLIKNHLEDSRARLAFGAQPLILRTLHLAINRKVPDAQWIIDHFNAELIKMVEDRSYNRLLQQDWLLADVDGDGKPEYIPRDDRVGPNPPDHSYQLFTDPAKAPASSSPQFYLGGKVYPTWSAVPDGYKANRPPGTFNDGSQFTIFTFKF